MARRNRDDVCLICSNLPCTCGKPVAPKKMIVPKVMPLTAGPVVIRQSPVVARRPGLSGLRTPVKKTTQQALPPATDAETDEMKRAVTVLVSTGLVAEQSIQEHRDLVDLSDTEIRAILWKQRRGDSGARP